MRKSRRIEPAHQRTYMRLRARVDRLEDAISYFYNVINQLRGRAAPDVGERIRSDEAGIGTALNRCRALATKIANELRNKEPGDFVELSLADIHASLERAADVSAR
jgi:hypothetical protein